MQRLSTGKFRMAMSARFVSWIPTPIRVYFSAASFYGRHEFIDQAAP
jgi:hypothetical protein